MLFGLFKKTDPICGMKEEKGKGLREHGEWFCSENCRTAYANKIQRMAKKQGRGGCCG